jgi:hypothetical protein
MANLPPVLKQYWTDANGNPLAGGKIYTYAAGTSTPQATYTDSTGDTESANPIVLDASGYAAMWLDPTLSYKFVVKDSTDVTQHTIDNVIGLLTANAVATASIQDDAVTQAKIADDAVGADQLKDSASTDADRAVTTNHIRDSAITTAKLAAASVTGAKLSTAVSSKTAAYTVTSTDDVILCDATSAAFTVTLPTAVGITGRTYDIQKTDSSANAVTVDGDGTETLRGQTTFKLATRYERIRIISDGANWQILTHEYPKGWETCTVTGLWVANTTYTAKRRRVGDSYEFDVTAETSGAPTATGLIVTLPSDTTIDTAKMSNSTVYENHIGTANIYDSSGAVDTEMLVALMTIVTSTTVRPMVIISSSGSGHWLSRVDSTTPVTFGAGDRVNMRFTVPVVGFEG